MVFPGTGTSADIAGLPVPDYFPAIHHEGPVRNTRTLGNSVGDEEAGDLYPGDAGPEGRGEGPG